MRTDRFTTAGVAALFVLSLLGWPAGSQAAAAPSTTTFSGQATAVKGSVLGLPVNSLFACTPPSPQNFCIVDTGPLTADQAVHGGAHEAAPTCYPSGPQRAIPPPRPHPTGGAGPPPRPSPPRPGGGEQSPDHGAVGGHSRHLLRPHAQ